MRVILGRDKFEAGCGKLYTIYQELNLIWQRAKISKYRKKNLKDVKISKCVFRFKKASTVQSCLKLERSVDAPGYVSESSTQSRLNFIEYLAAPGYDV